MVVEQIRELCSSLGLADVGFSTHAQPVYGLHNAVTLVARLSDAVVDSITDSPTHTYFHHYRTVNTYLDQCALRVGLLLECGGWRYVPVPASQTVDRKERRGLFSHKQAAVAAGLGRIGKNALFLSGKYGARVRLATVFTDMPVPQRADSGQVHGGCGTCRECVRRCPAMALSGEEFDPAAPERKLVDAQLCSEYMKKQFQLIGRGVVCGICMRYCPAGHNMQ